MVAPLLGPVGRPPQSRAMKTSLSARSESARQGWPRAVSILIALAVFALSVAVLLPKSHDGRLPPVLLVLVLVALAVAIALHARFLFLARREHHKTTSALRATEREFQSIFDSALDAILILDDRGTCLEANPAALAVLGTARQELIGCSIQEFVSCTNEEAWQHLVSPESGHGEMRLTRRNAEDIFVEYTAKANYLPGRHVAVLRDVSKRHDAEIALRESDERFRQMADNILEVYWMIDVDTKHVVYVNSAFEAVTGRSCETLRENPTSYQELFHPEDRVRVLTRLEEAVQTGQFDEEFRIIRPDHAIRWVWVRGFPVRDISGSARRLVGTAQDITARKSAEEQMARNLALAESARGEADAFRKITLALTQNLSMDNVLDTLLQSLLKLIPCESARVLLLETPTQLFLAREVQDSESTGRPPKCPATWDARESRFLMQVLRSRTSLLLADASQENDWKRFEGNSHFCSWLCVPLIASQNVLGLLSLGDTRARAFSREHLRLAKSLAIPAAVAIQNARLYERAEIYGAELEQRIGDLQQIQNALRLAEERRTLSEERFSKVFRSSPIAFSITTVKEGVFIDVNEAFERRYAYSRAELLGRSVFDIRIWDDPGERARMLQEIRQQGRVRNRITRFRKHSGEIVDTFYSADLIELDGRECFLAVSEDPPEHANLQSPLARNATVAP
jgi:PAS domain S-box-containing protein